MRGAGGEATCEDTSQICCYQENLISKTEMENEIASPPNIEAEPMVPKVDKETPHDELHFWKEALWNFVETKYHNIKIYGDHPDLSFLGSSAELIYSYCLQFGRFTDISIPDDIIQLICMYGFECKTNDAILIAQNAITNNMTYGHINKLITSTSSCESAQNKISNT